MKNARNITDAELEEITKELILFCFKHELLVVETIQPKQLKILKTIIKELLNLYE